MAKPENQLEEVRKRLSALPRKSWTAIAAGAELDMRTVENVANMSRAPAYDTVYRIYMQLQKATPKRAAAINAAKVIKPD